MPPLPCAAGREAGPVRRGQLFQEQHSPIDSPGSTRIRPPPRVISAHLIYSTDRGLITPNKWALTLWSGQGLVCLCSSWNWKSAVNRTAVVLSAIDCSYKTLPVRMSNPVTFIWFLSGRCNADTNVSRALFTSSNHVCSIQVSNSASCWNGKPCKCLKF